MKSQINAKIKREEQELKTLLEELPGNPVPWMAVVKIVAPLVARLAVRYALKKVKRGLSEERVTEVAGAVATLVNTVLGARASK